MRITLSLPDPVARKFRATVPPRQRSRLVAKLLAKELKKGDDALKAACLAANKDIALRREIDEWQAFEE